MIELRDKEKVKNKKKKNSQVAQPLPFRYPGGKFYALGLLRPFWAQVKHDEYREPFVGGGSIFFNKEKVKFNWLNDLDNELMATYRVMSDESSREALIGLLTKEEATKERWREVYNFTPKNELEVAYKYYYLNRTSFSGKLVSAAWGYRPKRSLPPERWHERIEPCGGRLSNVSLTNIDFEQVINAPCIGNNVLMFVDPPYYGPPKHKHYRCGFDKVDHIRLAEALKNTSHKFFLTYDDVPEVRELYDWANIYPLKFIYRVENSVIQEGMRKLGFELVITNYELEPANNFGQYSFL